MDARTYFESKTQAELEQLPPHLKDNVDSIQQYMVLIAKDGWNDYDNEPFVRRIINKWFQDIEQHEKIFQETLTSEEDYHVWNYFKKINSVTLKKLNDFMRGEHTYFSVVTNDGKDPWVYMKNQNGAAKRIDMYLEELNAWAKNGAVDQNLSGLGAAGDSEEKEYVYVDSLSYDQRVLNKFLHLKMKEKNPTRTEIRSLLNYIRRLLVERKIGKGTRNISMIDAIQQYLVDFTTKAKPVAAISIATIDKIDKQLIEKLKPEVLLLKRYIGLGGRDKEGKGGIRRVKNIAKDIYEEMVALEIAKSSKHYNEFMEAKANLKRFISPAKPGAKSQPLPLAWGYIHTLSGLDGADMEDQETLCAYAHVNGLESLCCA